MKKSNYIAPEVEFVKFANCDVLTASGEIERYDNDAADPFVI